MDLQLVHASSATRQPTFEAMGVPLLHAHNLRNANITAPNALQAAAYEHVAGGRDGVIHAHTGSGKTLAFLLPLLARLDAQRRVPQALVLCPSRELAYQTNRVAEMLLEGSGLGTACLAGGANPARQIEKVRKERPQLLIGSAGRVAELAFDWGKLSLRHLDTIVLDEVDEALLPPHLEHTMRILEHAREARGGRLQLNFASATADTPTVRRAAYQLMSEPVLIRLGGPSAATDDGSAGDAASSKRELMPDAITHGIVISQPNKLVETLARFARTEPKPKALVFVNSPRRAQVVCELLERNGVFAEAIYGDQEREERVAVMRDFLSGRVRLVVTTEMGARGLDIPELTHVVNLELPTDETHYVHRAGRCGRAGASGTVLSFAPPSSARVVEKHAARLGVALHEIRIHAGRLVFAGDGEASEEDSRAPSRARARPSPRKASRSAHRPKGAPRKNKEARTKRPSSGGAPRGDAEVASGSKRVSHS